MPIVSSDKFDRSDADVLGSDDQGHGWLVDAGRFGIRSNQCHALSPYNSAPLFRAYLDTFSEADVDLKVRVANYVGTRIGAMLRYQSNRDYYAFEIEPYPVGIARKVSLKKVIDGNETVLRSAYAQIIGAAD